MSGSSGNTSAGSKGGRSPRAENQDIIARHGHGAEQRSGDTDATTHARGKSDGGNDARTADPDAPTDEE
jgi:hypothetical protein